MIQDHWANQTPIHTVVKELKITEKTAIDWFNFWRYICVYKCIENINKIGGLGIIVEIDESKFCKAKYNRDVIWTWETVGFWGDWKKYPTLFLGSGAISWQPVIASNDHEMGRTQYNGNHRRVACIPAVGQHGVCSPNGKPQCQLRWPTDWCAHTKRGVHVGENKR